MPELNITAASPQDPEGTEGLTVQPLLVNAPPVVPLSGPQLMGIAALRGANNYSAGLGTPSGNGFLEWGTGMEGSLPFTVDQDGNVTASAVAADSITGQGTVGWINVTAYPYFADPSGTDDSAEILNTVFSAAAGATVYFPLTAAGGTYRVDSTVTVASLPVSIYADPGVSVEFYGTGPAFLIGNSSASPVQGTSVHNLTVDGTNAGAAAYGYQLGDASGVHLDDVHANNFTGTGSAGFCFLNRYTWLERMHGTAFASNCTTHFLYNGSPDATSFIRPDMSFQVAAGNADQVGLSLTNGAALDYGRVYLAGNFPAGATATGAVISLDATSGMQHSMLQVGVECDGSSGTGPVTVASAGGEIYRCYGDLNFTAAAIPFTASTGTPLVSYTGAVAGDNSLLPEWTIPAAQSGFTFSSVGYYYAPADNTIHLKGTVTLSAAQNAVTEIFSLPSGLIPSQSQHFVTYNTLSGYTAGDPSISVFVTSGSVCISPAGSSGNVVALDGIIIALGQNHT